MTRRTSRKRTSLRRNSYTGDRVDPAGKKVVKAFLDKRSADSKKLWTDGKRLDGLWMGGRGIAEWVGDKIVFSDPGGRAAQTVQRMIRREAPPNWLKPNVGRRTSRHDRGRRSSRATRRASLRRNSTSYDVKYFIETTLSRGHELGHDAGRRDAWLRKWGKPTKAALRKVVLSSPIAPFVVTARVVEQTTGKTIATYSIVGPESGRR